MYATALSSPGVPGPRPSSESSLRFLMCRSMASAFMTDAAESTAAGSAFDAALLPLFAEHAAKTRSVVARADLFLICEGERDWDRGERVVKREGTEGLAL